MRMAELSTESGVPVATVKYYLREGLLPAGRRIGPNQAQYSDEHLRRLRLVCALREIGGLSLAEVAAVLAALDSGHASPVVLGVAQDGRVSTRPTGEAARAWALDRVRALLGEHDGGTVDAADPSIANLVTVLATFHALGHSAVTGKLADYAALARATAEVDAGLIADVGPARRPAETALITTLLGERLFAGLRHLALVNVVRAETAEA
ncbi:MULTISPECIES: MerR family transcriptional regulator [unclassified Amycolatopsis]|uniref:MerR family transcriptional regulator n=1 Tax=unclassified Amycolatopsis TaxID=2618356 RepID=UPI002E10E9ED|nr:MULTISPECIES: MerR family transcriptional regulator [unclassified Amycolatopsis]WSK76738.1 MerR family transcriptional regulator [Amycolatopsis sp. NBC_01286]